MEWVGLKVDDLVVCLCSQNHQTFPSRRIRLVNARDVFLHELNRLLAGQPLNTSIRAASPDFLGNDACSQRAPEATSLDNQNIFLNLSVEVTAFATLY